MRYGIIWLLTMAISVPLVSLATNGSQFAIGVSMFISFGWVALTALGEIRADTSRKTRTMSSRQMAEKLWREAIEPNFDGVFGFDCELEPEALEAAHQVMEGLLERHAGLQPDRDLQRKRDDNESSQKG